VNGSTYWRQGGYAYNNAGNLFCSDGALTQENCNGYIDYCGATVLYDDGTHATNLCVTHSTDGSRLVQEGDSGGPIVSGNMLQRGIISGGNVNNGPGNQLYFSPWEMVANQVGGHPCPC
jgi:hypothetical protein